jgi:hypothetical protein
MFVKKRDRPAQTYLFLLAVIKAVILSVLSKCFPQLPRFATEYNRKQQTNREKNEAYTNTNFNEKTVILHYSLMLLGEWWKESKLTFKCLLGSKFLSEIMKVLLT